MNTNPPHPAEYNSAFVPIFAELLQGCENIFDPFAGNGRKLSLLQKLLPNTKITGIEIEPHWAALHPEIIIIGNALNIPFPHSYFDGGLSSPTYGNRMADHHFAQDTSKRNTYTHAYGATLNINNSGTLQWGAQYRRFHIKAWSELARVLKNGSPFVLNIKNHIRKGQVVDVTQFHLDALSEWFYIGKHIKVPTKGLPFGSNSEVRVEYESIVRMFRKNHL